ncbi:hypothetical protein EVAR_15847_1 [Eumeta japonica]|uniref:Uncharacterized protein n=1 Tax=Eumeta variegata TaxID=151549 RepID=A0A4C1UDW5_EUMVA|nr:hypothetical protein EVAR_15847_1 [Eumeta japonica]
MHHKHTKEEFAVLQRMVRLMRYPEIVDSDHKLLVWLGINNLDDYRVWKNVHDYHLPLGFDRIKTVTRNGIGIESRTENRFEKETRIRIDSGTGSEIGNATGDENNCGDGIIIKKTEI